ncbi:MAG: glycosyltransferase family 2 protein [Eubacteriales bacterium]|nr:glycosyltransferase family 2 protein [Eubacteriales bacterium]
MTDQPLISIIVPIYNVEPYLRRCVDSILAQTYTNIEVILVDDGSPDGCPAICDEYQKADSRVKVIHKENGGVSEARNSGISYASGEYIVFCDGDDIVSCKYLEKLYDLCTSENSLSICSHERIYSYDGLKLPEADKELTISGKEALKKLLVGGLSVSVCGVLFKKNLIEKLRFDTTIRHNEDKLFLFEYILKNMEKSVTVSSEKHYGYMVREGSATKSKHIKVDTGVVKAAERMLDLTRENIPELLPYAQSAKSGADINFLKEYHCSRIALDEDYFAKKAEVLRSGVSKTSGLTARTEFLALQIGDWAFDALVKAYYGLVSEKMRFKRNERNTKL